MFVSHCGLMSATESMYHQVALVCIPFFADQLGETPRSDDAVLICVYSQELPCALCKQAPAFVLTDTRFQPWNCVLRSSLCSTLQPTKPANSQGRWLGALTWLDCLVACVELLI